MILNGTNEFLLYIHGKGEEYFLHYEYWPMAPYIYHSKNQEYWEDIAIEKELYIKNQDCKGGSHVYFSKLFLIPSAWEDIYVGFQLVIIKY